MKRFILFALATVLLGACSTKEIDFQTPVQDDVVFYASFEQPKEDGTRIYANEDLLLRWTADDRVSIFNKNTYNQQYKFTGETGDNAGGFDKVTGSELTTGNAIPHIVSVYPYQESTKITESETITVTLPAEQHYAENSFGLGANTMVSVSDDNVLMYKNVSGYLRISLYGEAVSVSSITLKGNNGEKLAGKASVTMPLDGVPTAVLGDDTTSEITLICETPVQLGATAEESTQFWFIVPPVAFSKGFTITVFGNGGVFEKATEKAVTIERNKLSKMSPIEVELSQPRNVIYYTSSDGNVVTPNNPDAFGASILSNEYVNELGIIAFDGDVTCIGDDAFSYCRSLSSITIPDSVTSIGSLAFIGCSGLTKVIVSNGVTSIGDYAFSGCTSLASITIPDSVTYIGSYAFMYCTITNITIPDSVTYIGSYAFYDCTSLTSIIIPDSITYIGSYTFYDCTSLTNISIPDSVTSIGSYAFYLCTSLTNITIPDSVTSIGDFAFSYCTSLTYISIPDSVTKIGYGIFRLCSSLVSFSGKFASSDGLFLIDSESVIAVALGAINGIVTIPDSVTRIGSYAFNGCKGLTKVIVSNGVTSIGDYAFSGCTSLSSVTIPDSVTSISIGSNAFSSCISLTSFAIPNGMTYIGTSVFQHCTDLTSITIPDSVTSIGNRAFNGCTSLTSITIPESVIGIGSIAFWSCSSLTSIILFPKIPPTGGSGMFRDTNNCPIYVPSESVNAYKSAEYWCDYADRIQAIPSVPVPEAVDLGLPSSLKWASFNLGASSPEEYGDYYAWGETEPYYSSLDPLTWKEGKEAGYAWSTYKWCKGEANTLTKYCSNSSYGYNGFTDTKVVLDPEDDAANMTLGGKWRMPTSIEMEELFNECSFEWTSKNGACGYKATGPNGNSIFLPAAGCFGDCKMQDVGEVGYYWIPARYDEADIAHMSVLSRNGLNTEATFTRPSGFSIRPVCD